MTEKPAFLPFDPSDLIPFDPADLLPFDPIAFARDFRPWDATELQPFDPADFRRATFEGVEAWAAEKVDANRDV